MCLTDHPKNRIPFAKPDGYDPLVYELLLRNFEAGEKGMPWINSSMPKRKTDTNNRTAFSTDLIGHNYDYPEASYSERGAINQRHRGYQQGLMWTLANHPRVPDHIRREVARWGMCRDEFEREDGWQQQLYVRGGAAHDRSHGDDATSLPRTRGSLKTRSAWLPTRWIPTMFSVMSMRSGHVRNEGDVEVGGFSPYAISYSSLTPKAEAVRELARPRLPERVAHRVWLNSNGTCVHGPRPVSPRLPPCKPSKLMCTVQAVNYDALKQKLIADGQVLAWTGPVRKTSGIDRSEDAGRNCCR